MACERCLFNAVNNLSCRERMLECSRASHHGVSAYLSVHVRIGQEDVAVEGVVHESLCDQKTTMSSLQN